MELRQLRYFVTLAEELHFGRAAERQHIVQSALSRQVQRLERELGVRLLERSTHHVALTAAGVVFLAEAREILAHVGRAAQAAQPARGAAGAAAPLRVGVIDSSYDSMPQILHEVQARYPSLVIHQVEAGVPGQYQRLIDGRLDVGVGRAALAPPQIASLLFREDPLGVLVPTAHPFAGRDGVSVAALAREPLLLAEEAKAPEFNQFTIEVCRAAGFTPSVYLGTVESGKSAIGLSPAPRPIAAANRAAHSIIAARSPVMRVHVGSSLTPAEPPSPVTVAGYDGTTPFTGGSGPPATFQGRLRGAVTVMVVGVPFAGLAVAVWLAWGHGLNLPDILLAAVFYVITGLGVTIGFHRLLTHRSFTAVPALRIVLAVAGSMSFQGDVTGWVATHRRHHAFTDRPGDPHSPYRYGTSPAAQLRGLAHAHVGWLLRDDPTPAARYAPDMTADRTMRAISAAFPALCALSLALPFGAGWLIGGTWHAALAALLWAGLVRVTVLQHVTWSVNSLCHVLGSRPFATRQHDRATNLWPLALVSFGESWHNMHHSDPACARHGADPGQVDISATVIHVFERLGWASKVHWPVPARLAARRHSTVRLGS